MYTINRVQNLDNDILEITEAHNLTYAKIHLNLGGSLQELILNEHHIIKDLKPLTYNNTYASSILFPFANRIEDGIYKFEEKDYFLNINQLQENNALHGFVYNKTFELVEDKVTPEEAVVLLRYEEQFHTKGFPYTYCIDLKHTITKESLDLCVSIKNIDSKAIGWHPYFNCSNLFNSIVRFKSSKRAVFNKRNISQGFNDFDVNDDFKIENKSLDDCFVLESNNILFETPDYSFELTSSEKKVLFAIIHAIIS